MTLDHGSYRYNRFYLFTIVHGLLDFSVLGPKLRSEPVDDLMKEKGSNQRSDFLPPSSP